MSKIALLIIDVQKEYEKMEKCGAAIHDALEYINETSMNFRKAGQPVIFIQDEEPGVDNEGFQLVDDLTMDDSDHYVSKIHNNAFYETELEKLLKDMDVDYVVVSGFAAEFCVLATYNGAQERGFGVSMLQHGVASFYPGQVKEAHHIRSIVSYDILAYLLEQKK